MSNRKVIKYVKIGLISLIACGVVALGVGYFVIRDIWGNPLKYLFGNQSRDHEVTLDDGSKVEFNTNIINVLLLGTDSDSQRAQNSAGYRADSNILLSVDLTNYKAAMVGFSRDTVVEQDLMKNNKSTGTTKDKLAHAFSGNSGVGGRNLIKRAENSKRAIERLITKTGLRIPIDNMIVIDMDGLSKMVDALDYVEFTLEDNVTGFGKAGETIKLNGTKALEFVRMRKGLSGGDETRIDHHQQFLIALARRIKEKGAVSVVPSLISSLGNAIEYDFDMDTILVLAKALDRFDLDGMTMKTIPMKSNDEPDMDVLKATLIETYYVGEGAVQSEQ